MAYRYDTHCGLYCGACEVLQANRTGTVEQTANKWKMNAADITCHGCKSSVVSIYCKKCDIKECARKTGVDNCSACDRFPCKKIRDLNNDRNAHHSVVLGNLRIIGASGMKSWLRQQDKRWRCKSCGKRFSWYAKQCKGCGATLYNSISEDTDLKRKMTE